MRLCLPLAVWQVVAGWGYDLGDWAMGHVPDAVPDEACRERMWERIEARRARGWRHGLTISPLVDDDVTTGVAALLSAYIQVNARAGGMHGMVPSGDTDEGQDA